MEKLHNKIISWSKEQKLQVIYSSCNTPSEGEHKLLQFIRTNQKENNTNIGGNKPGLFLISNN